MEENKIICTGCKKYYDVSSFFKSKAYKRGLTNWCKSCHAKATKKYSDKNKDKIKEQNAKARSKENKSKRREYQIKYQADNRKTLNEKKRNYRKRKPEIVRSVDKKSYASRRKAITDNSVFVTPLFLRNLKKSSEVCEICGKKGTNFELDHILPICIGGKHEIENLRYICGGCNRSRPKDGSDLIGTKHEYLLLKTKQDAI